MTPIRFCTIVVHRYLLPAKLPLQGPFKGPPRAMRTSSVISFSLHQVHGVHRGCLHRHLHLWVGRQASIKRWQKRTHWSAKTFVQICQIYVLLFRVCPGGIHLLERCLELARLLSHRDVLCYHRCRPWQVGLTNTSLLKVHQLDIAQFLGAANIPSVSCFEVSGCHSWPQDHRVGHCLLRQEPQGRHHPHPLRPRCVCPPWLTGTCYYIISYF